MQYFYVKKDLWGVQAGRVERFSPTAAAPLVANGSLEPFDPKKHSDYPGASDVPGELAPKKK